ncbi:GNAT family N-acetyltransferase [uncultured Nocardioides sp.]|uniref:GNAT family N-acetyltransferase n=1 Tax=uncultured Nocardioides sp. TaxID=198441 RepID=UPI0025ED1270|nr:GNAT family N-acetyltransferase [uncultured Nocardioides sp.]
MRIRLATDADLEAVGDITVAAYTQFTLGPDDPYVARLRDSATRAAQAQLWVAEDDDGTVLGSVTLCPPGSPWREISRPGEGEFRMLAVAPQARGRGVGEALTRHVLALCAAAGEEVVVISSLAEMTAAHRIYARLGFRRLPDRDWSPDDDVHLIAFVRDGREG